MTEQPGLDPGQVHAHGTFVPTCWVCQSERADAAEARCAKLEEELEGLRHEQ